MAKCDVCGQQENMPYECRHCGGTHCGEHRLPENHGCSGLHDWNDPKGVFNSGFDDSVNSSAEASTTEKIASKLPFDTGSSGVLGYFRGNMTYTLLALMWLTMAAQFLAYSIGGRELHETLFTLSTANPTYVWTWVTSVFAHSPFFIIGAQGPEGSIFHIVFNSIVIFFFGPLVERYIGSRDFAILFVVSGVLAGIGQVGLASLLGEPSSVLGASGAALAIIGVVTILNPDLRVYLFFVLAMPIWVLAAGTVAISMLFIVLGSPGAGGIAHGAHLVGLLIGLAYGEYLKRTRNFRVPSQIQMGGGGGPGGPGGPGRGRGPF
ncbi:rhomboid family protein [Halostagnicola larsenii XH-48]|uniref:Rhomboid family protein n=1 Tax=Halostagnicola larsenii XH-48 TaxID=797299 RepID=W0JS52_9EURY|nr:rhomboid family intramembrane serine protease [Halostagnicola larsenii]AHF99787.1 rhomboid family protein [Halostagnicola larsenii XH-48]